MSTMMSWLLHEEPFGAKEEIQIQAKGQEDQDQVTQE